jgi:hypothetical protein
MVLVRNGSDNCTVLDDAVYDSVAAYATFHSLSVTLSSVAHILTTIGEVVLCDFDVVHFSNLFPLTLRVL